MLHFFRNLLIFGEGGDGGDGAGAAPAAAPDGQAAENSGVTVPDAGERKRLSKAERRANFEAKLKAEQAQQAQPQQPKENAPAEQSPEEAFKALINGQYKEQFNKIMNGRFQKAKATEDELNTAKSDIAKRDELLDQLARAQGIEPGADGKISLDAIEKFTNRSRVEKYAMENGVSEEFAEQRINLENELKTKTQQIQQMKQEQQEREQYAMYLRIRGAAEEARRTYPGMDVDATVNDPRFAHLIKVLPPAAAYHALHQVEMTTQAMQYAVDTTKAATAATIQAGMARPSEGGLGRSAPAKIQTDVTNKKWREQIKRDARRGKFAEF